MSEVVYDAAVLIAADRNDRRVWSDHKALLESGIVPWVPAAVVARVSRTARQVQLRRFLRGCIVVPLDEATAHAAGRLLGTTRASDVVDASVVILAINHRARIVTGDADDIERLVGVRLAHLEGDGAMPLCEPGQRHGRCPQRHRSPSGRTGHGSTP